MSDNKHKARALLPLPIIRKAQTGDIQAVNQVLEHYQGYINKLCTRRLCEENGEYHVRVDEFMKSRLENKLIHTIVRMQTDHQS